MADNKAIKIWSNVLEDVCGCYADSEGNRPCDYGATCTKCETIMVDREYRRRLEEYHIGKWSSTPPVPKKKFTICLHDIVTYWDIEAETETEAIEQALDMWIDRRPRCEVTEQKD
jgi:hypothetical protein